MNKMNTLGRLALSLLASLVCLSVSAQKLALTFNNVSLSDALKQIDQAQELKHVHFVFDELEDFRVTKTISSESAYDAVREVCGFYPMLISMKGKDIFVECAQKDDAKLIGRVVDENGKALEFANVALYSVPDSTFITGGVTNKNGDFVIPCGKKNVHVNFSYIGFETKEMKVEFPGGAKSLNIGTITLNEDKKIIREVLVEQTLASTSAEKSEYLPSKKQKNAATDATSLLQHMQIPQLRLNPLTGYVTTLSGDGVSIFIDYMPATQEDLAGMNTQDVKRVEIYDFPKDVRFQNKPHVINFVMQKYELGGYTKLTNTEMVLADFTTINSLYSKLAHKNWTFDANVSYRFFGQSHIGNESEETFNLPAETIHRKEFSDNGRQDKGITSASFRATYNTEKIQLANRLELLDNNTMKQDIFGSVSYHPDLFKATNTTSHLTSHETTPTYTGDWFFVLPKDWTLTINPTFQFSHIEQNRFYIENSPIEYHVKENAYKAEWVLLAGKTFAQQHSLQAGTYGFNYNSSMEYSGSTVANQNMNYLALGIPVVYQFQAEKLNLEAQVVATYERNDVNGESFSKWAPMASIAANYAFNQKNSLEAELGIGLSGANGAERNPNIIQEHELLFYCGNPLLKTYNSYLGMLQYNWMPSNKFTASAFLQHFYNYNYFAKVWNLHNDGTAILRRFDNVGNANLTEMGANFTLRMLEGKLQFNTSPQISIIRTSGIYRENASAFNLSLSAAYYMGAFYLNSGYTMPEKKYNRENHTWQHDRSFYYVVAGWGNKHWKTKLEVVNPFRTDWRATKKTITTPLYTRTSTALNNNAHQHLTFTLTYIFNYGKKVKQGNELGTASGGQSSIL